MPTLYKVTTSPNAPSMRLTDAPHNKGLLPFNGSSKAKLSEKSFEVWAPHPVTDPAEFWFLAPGVLVYPEDMIGPNPCESPYYCWAYHGELLSVVSSTDAFRVLNVQSFYPHPRLNDQFDLRYSYPLFRLEGEDPASLFTLEGQQVKDDELIATYNRYGLKGLVFETYFEW